MKTLPLLIPPHHTITPSEKQKQKEDDRNFLYFCCFMGSVVVGIIAMVYVFFTM